MFGFGKKAQGAVGVFPLEQLFEIALLVDPPAGAHVELTVFRQSGNMDRQMVGSSSEAALNEASRVFNRMREDSFRVWKNEETILDIRRPFGSSSGSREGRKIWGVDIRLVND